MDVEALVEALEAPCAELGVEVVDAELMRGGAGGRSSSVLRVTVEGQGAALDLDAVAEVSAVISAVLDADEQLTPSGRYDLEVTSPGVERRLRRPAHFRRAIGSQVAVKTRPGTPGERRLQGRLEAAGDDGVTLSLGADATSGSPAHAGGGERTLPYEAIESAHTVFDWRAALAESRRSDGTDVRGGHGQRGPRPRRRGEGPEAAGGGIDTPAGHTDERGVSGEDDEERAALR